MAYFNAMEQENAILEIQRILRETRSGALEPGEALDSIWSFYKTD